MAGIVLTLEQKNQEAKIIHWKVYIIQCGNIKYFSMKRESNFLYLHFSFIILKKAMSQYFLKLNFL